MIPLRKPKKFNQKTENLYFVTALPKSVALFFLMPNVNLEPGSEKKSRRIPDSYINKSMSLS